MKRDVFLAFAVSLSFAAHAQWEYPATRTVDASDTYFGKTYKDPYRWLENLKDKEVEAWFKAQAELTDRLLAKIPARDALAEEWMALDKFKLKDLASQFACLLWQTGQKEFQPVN
jgi:prolyl oligopeptidase